MNNIIGLLNDLVPYPYFDTKGRANDGNVVKIPKECTFCNKKCLKTLSLSKQKVFLCSSGLNSYRIEYNNSNTIIFGIFIRGLYGKMPRKQKKVLHGILVDERDLKNFEFKLSELVREINEFKDRKIQDNFSLFHDIIPTISLIFRTVESLINSVEGETFEKKVENAEIKLKNLYHSIDLLDNRLKIMPLIGNPESAKYGQVTKCSPYKVFDKVCRLFTETASRKGVKLFLHSDKYITLEPTVYDSFMTLPFLLIENAIKYSVKNRTIDIYLQHVSDGLMITITSYGPIVSDENTLKIFEKGFKDPNAQRFSSKGSGIGLYLADIVAKAHNIEISYICEKDQTPVGEIELGFNKFSIFLKK